MKDVLLNVIKIRFQTLIIINSVLTSVDITPRLKKLNMIIADNIIGYGDTDFEKVGNSYGTKRFPMHSHWPNISANDPDPGLG